jgi:hypothetical protein
MEVSDARKLKALEDENRKLKKLQAETVLRGLSGARDEFHLAAVVQNLKTLAGHVWRPPPNTQAACLV